MKTGNTNRAVKKFTTSMAMVNILSNIVIYSNLNVNHYLYKRGVSIIALRAAKKDTSPKKPRERIRKRRKNINLPMFRLPTQLLIHVQ